MRRFPRPARGPAAAVIAAGAAALALAACGSTPAGPGSASTGSASTGSASTGSASTGPSGAPAVSHPASAAAAAAHFKIEAASCAGAAAAYDVTDAGTAAWAAQLPGSSQTGQAVAPAAIDGLAVFAFGNVVSARRLTDGQQVWQRVYPGPAGSSASGASGASDAGDVGGVWAWHGELIVLVAPTDLGQRPVDMRVQAISPATGAVRWTLDLGLGDLYNDQVITSGGVLAVLTETGGAGGLGQLMGVDLNAGRLLWSRPYGQQELTDGPDAAGGVIVMAEHGTVTGFDASTGAVLWSHGGLPGPVGSVAGPGGLVLLYDLFQQTLPGGQPVPPSRLFPVTALDARTGAVRWRVPTAGPVSQLSAADGLILIGTSGSYRLTLVSPSGRVIWSVPEYVANPVTWVEVGTDLVYVSSEPNEMAEGAAPVPTRLVDRRLATGAVRWSTPLGDSSAAQVVWPYGGNLLAIEEPGTSGAPATVAVDPATGQVRGSATLAPLATGPLAVTGGDTLMEMTSAPCPEAEAPGPAVTASSQPSGGSG